MCSDDPCDDWSVSDLSRLNDKTAPEDAVPHVDVEEVMPLRVDPTPTPTKQRPIG